MSYCVLEGVQEEIRTYFIQHQKEFNIIKMDKEGDRVIPLNRKPDFFALLCATVADLSLCKNWKDVYNQLNDGKVKSENYKFCDYGDGEIAELDALQCMCSHYCCPENMSIITNPYTGLNAFIACDCLQKTGIISSYQFKKNAQLNSSYKKMIKRREKKNKCKKCIEEMKKKCRECAQCGTFNILKTEPAWKKKCLLCHTGTGTGKCLLTLPRKSSL
jgi:hypothetical protein